MEIRRELQLNPVADEVSAITAAVRPILRGTLYSLRSEVVAPLGGYGSVPLYMLADLRNPGDGDCGISFEYAIHDALVRGDAVVSERVHDALARCNVRGDALASILFGLEKTGTQNLIETVSGLLTTDSRLMSGYRGQPVKLTRHLGSVAAAFRSPRARAGLPQSISGLWKADMFVGDTGPDRWVGASVKINPRDLEGARGLRIGIVPTQQGRSDGIRLDDRRNLVICPVPYDGSFMETFYRAWEVVTMFLAAHANVPKEVNLPGPAQRQVARYLADRRQYSTLEVIEALTHLAQPGLLDSSEEEADLEVRSGGDLVTTSFIAPQPRS